MPHSCQVSARPSGSAARRQERRDRGLQDPPGYGYIGAPHPLRLFISPDNTRGGEWLKARGGTGGTTATRGRPWASST